jgi:hypothetical protein
MRTRRLVHADFRACPRRHAGGAVLRLLVLLSVAWVAQTGTPAPALAQSTARPWLGVALPPGLGDPHSLPVALPADFTLPAAVVPQGEEINTMLRGEEIRRDLEAIIGFSKESRAAGDRMWGRITGRPSLARTIEWVAQRFREIGLQDVEVQTYASTASMWWPVAWEVRLVGDAAYGTGTPDVILESALPTGGSAIAGEITAPLVFVGPVGQAPDAEIDVAGKIAVQLLTPASGAYSERGRTVDAARALMGRGAVAVLNAVRQPGNMHVRDFSNCGGPCFNLGGADTDFILGVLERAQQAGLPQPRARLTLQTETLTGLEGHNAVGVIPGSVPDVLIVNAHADGWFDAAGDNADGLAVLLALARYFVEPDNQPVRTLVFVASGGHHSGGMNGPANFVRMNPEIAERTDLVVNLEHIAQLELNPAEGRFQPTEQRMNFGISNQSAYLMDVARRGIRRYGYRLADTFPSSVPGDLGGYGTLNAARVQAIHSGPLYHTSGDVLESISIPGLERAARFFEYFIRETARAPDGWVNP